MFHQPTTLHLASMKRHRHWGLCTALCKSRQLSMPQAHRGHAHRAAQSLRHAPSGVDRKKRVDLSDATQISSAQTMNLPALEQLRCIEQGLQRAMSGSICIRALTGSNAVRYSTYLKGWTARVLRMRAAGTDCCGGRWALRWLFRAL